MHAPDHDEAARSSRLVRVRIRLTSALWVPVLFANALAVALALGLPWIDEHLDGEHLPIAVSAAQQILAALAAGMITFTGIIFSAVFVAAQIQTSSYSPRLAARLRRDPVVIAGLAFPTATATYATFALAAVGRRTGSRGDDFVPAATIVLALVLLVVTPLMLRTPGVPVVIRWRDRRADARRQTPTSAAGGATAAVACMPVSFGRRTAAARPITASTARQTMART
jgi:hypothetical protein